MVSYFFVSPWLIVAFLNYSHKSDPVLVKDQKELKVTPTLMRPSSEEAKNQAQEALQMLVRPLSPLLELLLLMN